MSPAEIKAAFHESKKRVDENNAKLNNCPSKIHEFAQIEQKIFSKWRCAHCGGEVDVSAVFWYRRGLDHAKR